MEKKSQTIWEMALQNAKTEVIYKKQVNDMTGYNEKIYLGRELILLFSNRAGLLSSKKIERMVIFLSLLTVTIVLLSKRIEEIEVLEFIEIVGIWLGYGGWNSYMTFRDKKLLQNEQKDIPTDTNVEVPSDYAVNDVPR